MWRSYCMKISTNNIIVIREFIEMKIRPARCDVCDHGKWFKIHYFHWILSIVFDVKEKEKKSKMKIIGTALHWVDDDDIILSSFRHTHIHRNTNDSLIRISILFYDIITAIVTQRLCAALCFINTLCPNENRWAFDWQQFVLVKIVSFKKRTVPLKCQLAVERVSLGSKKLYATRKGQKFKGEN